MSSSWFHSYVFLHLTGITITGSLTMMRAQVTSANGVRVLGNGKLTLISTTIDKIQGEGIYLADNATLACSGSNSHLGRLSSRGRQYSRKGKMNIKSYDQVGWFIIL